jgi:hypothetical protein
MQSPRHRQSDELRHQLEEGPKDELRHEEGLVIEQARFALSQAIRQYASPKSNKLRLTVIAVSGLFADLTRGMAALPGVLDIINMQLAGAGLEVVKKRQN